MKKTKTKRPASRAAHLKKLLAISAVAVVLAGSAFYSYAQTPPHTKPLTKPQTARISHHPLDAKKPTTDTTPVSKPAPTPAPTQVATVSPAPAPKPTPIPAPAPVVPSPSSSVDNLTPTSTSTTTTSTSTTSTADTSSTSQSSTTTANSSPIDPATTYSSTNWSGYLSAGGYYTAISASWVAPAATGTGTGESGDATWIGIGGVTSDDLIQIGTENFIEPGGQVSTGAFYELLPDVAQPVTGVTVAAGDTITASISQVSATRWTFNLTDVTSGQSYTSTVTYTSKNSSAEWVEEDPSYASGSLVPFDNFGTVSFMGASTTVNGTAMDITDAQGSNITMVASPGHTTVAKTSAVGSDGASFTVARKNAG